jgi:4-hydroxy-tetrahydrodipicolinate synthase
MSVRTVFGMMATPFTADNQIDEPALRAHLRRVVDADVGVYLGAGGAGEGHALSAQEMRRVLEIGVEECRGRVPTYATIPEARTGAATIERCRLAMTTGVEVIQIFFPDAGHGMRPRPEEQERFYHDILAAIDHPLALSVHAHSGFFPSIQLLSRLCKEHRNIVAINAMLTPMAYVVELMDTLGPRLAVYTAIKDFVDGIVLGANGCLAAEPNIIPHSCRRVLSAFETNDLQTLRTSFAHLLRFGTIVNRWAPSTARWVKMAMKVLDLPGGNGALREPYVMPPPAELEEMARAFEELDVRRVEGLA